MKILITGAAGFIGSNLLPRLSAEHEVVALTRKPESRSLAPGATIAVDLARSAANWQLPTRVDSVIHLAQANVPFPDCANEMFAVNTVATQTLLDYARLAGARQFILASSGDVYGARLGLAKESDETHPESFYAVTKRASELLTFSYREYLQPCVLRLFQPFGPGQSNRLIPKLADRIRLGESVKLNKDGRPHVTPFYIADVVSAFLRAVDGSLAGTVNLAGDTRVSVRELAGAIGCALGREPRFEETVEEAGDVMGSNDLMKQTLGDWEMVSLTEGLARTFGGQGG